MPYIGYDLDSVRNPITNLIAKPAQQSKSLFLKTGKLARARRRERKAVDEQNQKSY